MIWEAATGKALQRRDVERLGQYLLFSPDGKTLLWQHWGNKDQEANSTRLVDVASGKERLTIGGLEGPATFSPDGRLLAARSLGTGKIGLWKTDSGARERQLDGPGWSIAFSADGGDLIAAGNGELRRWELAGGKQLQVTLFGGHRNAVGGLAFSPDGKWLASADAAETRLWDPATGTARRRIPCENSYLYLFPTSPFTFAGDGSTLAALTLDGIVRWNTTTGEQRSRQQIGKQDLNHVLSPEGHWVAALDGDKGICVVEAATGKEWHRLPGALPLASRLTRSCWLPTRRKIARTSWLSGTSSRPSKLVAMALAMMTPTFLPLFSPPMAGAC